MWQQLLQHYVCVCVCGTWAANFAFAAVAEELSKLRRVFRRVLRQPHDNVIKVNDSPLYISLPLFLPLSLATCNMRQTIEQLIEEENQNAVIESNWKAKKPNANVARKGRAKERESEGERARQRQNFILQRDMLQVVCVCVCVVTTCILNVYLHAMCVQRQNFCLRLCLHFQNGANKGLTEDLNNNNKKCKSSKKKLRKKVLNASSVQLLVEHVL